MHKIKILPIKNADKLCTYWFNCKVIMIFLTFFGVTYNLLTVLTPVFLGKLLDLIVKYGTFNKVKFALINYIVIILLIQVTRFFKRFYVRRFANITSGTMRLMIYNNIINRDLPNLTNESIGNLMTRAISDVEICVEGMRKVTTEVFDTGVLMVGCLCILIHYDIKITILTCMFVPFAMFLAEKLKKTIYKYSRDYRKKSSEVSNITYENINHTLLYRINGVEKHVRENYFHDLEELSHKAIKANMLENSMQPLYNAISLFGIVFLLYFGGKKVANGLWTIGMFSSYMSTFTLLSVKASKACKLFNSAQKAKISWNRIKPYLGEYFEKDHTAIELHVHNTLTVKDLCFSYGEHKDNPIIKNMNFKAKSGDIIGITGPIACGKSSLGISLLGLYNYEGSIMINDKELKEYTDFQKSQLISYSGHNPQLLSDTIYNNICIGDTTNLDSLLEDIDFMLDLMRMKDGYNTLVGDNGIKLSGGQQARISLGRALLNKNPIIILDDPFSAVDINTEKHIIANLKKHYKNCIILIISHRLSIFPELTHIIMMQKQGSYIYGTHEELMTCCSEYSNIYNLQKGGEHYEICQE